MIVKMIQSNRPSVTNVGQSPLNPPYKQFISCQLKTPFPFSPLSDCWETDAGVAVWNIRPSSENIRLIWTQQFQQRGEETASSQGRFQHRLRVRNCNCFTYLQHFYAILPAAADIWLRSQCIFANLLLSYLFLISLRQSILESPPSDRWSGRLSPPTCPASPGQGPAPGPAPPSSTPAWTTSAPGPAISPASARGRRGESDTIPSFYLILDSASISLLT